MSAPADKSTEKTGTTNGFAFGEAPKTDGKQSDFVFTPQTQQRSSVSSNKSKQGDNQAGDDESGHHDLVPQEEANVYFEPLVKLQEVDVKTLEEDEDELLCLRARLYRWGQALESEEMQWKERGTGDVKLLKHKERGVVRVLMRQEKTLKICANHVITDDMELKEHQGSDTTWTYVCLADYSDGEFKPETLAIRFRNEEAAQKYKTTFNEAKDLNKAGAQGTDEAKAEEDLTEEVAKLSVKESS
ncbi:hypothetical protein SARC_08183 [Sphaeroforma arctica JP610]|uniref:RanBD1 domain-containing protein n=1 Tax=Sphaeroforma arctica JP610 TaxID=667725 RepID=A0A0L0FRV7_9EUKA|nr:hypothetical protein SARC_08183 [Sphaeroforma arctica JP610]KNC79429.1 hypothetical protein SARC_08183 [Sphaeroforma arctica JP610]|eukprot:XP_014153331.1 hypothetical protein SARC_08183 [Sphaeroforma arctica JP610]